MKGVHLKPVGHSRADPDGEKIQLLCTDARQTAEETGYMVLSVPLRQVAEIIADGIEGLNLIGLHHLHDVHLGTALLADPLTFGVDDDTVQCLLGQHTPDGLLTTRQGKEFDLSAQLIETEEVVVF